MKKILALIILILTFLCAPVFGASVPGYNNYPPTADKVLQPDGSIVSIVNGTTISGANAGRARQYISAPAIAAKYMMPDGSIINGIPLNTAISGDSTSGYCVKADGSGGLEYGQCSAFPYNPAAVAITGGTITGTGISIPMVSATDGLALTVAQASGTSLNNQGQAAAITVTLPPAAEGLNLLVVVGTQYNGIFKIQRAGTDTIIADGVPGKTYVMETNQAVGSEIAIRAFKTGASAWTWKCTTVSGTWTTD